MRLPNSYGSVYKLSGTRRKPWAVKVTAGWQLDDATKEVKQIQKYIGYFRTRQEALACLSEYNQHPFDLNTFEITLAEVYDLVEPSFTEGRRNNYRAAYKYLEPIKDMPIRNIKLAMMQKCIDDCHTTQQIEIRTLLHKIYKYALVNEIIDRDPSKHLTSEAISERKERKIFTADEITDLWNQDVWWSKITLMLLYSGMRTKELRMLHPDEINEWIDIEKAKNRPSVRKIPIHSRVLPLFSDYKSFGCNLYGYTHDGLNKTLKARYGHTAHEARHTFTSKMRECGCDPLVLQILLGHAPTTITERVYTHISDQELRNSIEKLVY